MVDKISGEQQLLNAIFEHETPADAEPLSEAQQKELKRKIDSVLKTLSFREREIIKLRYGLADGEPCTQKEAGRIFKLTRERIRRIETKGLQKLQHPIRSKQLEGFLKPIE